MQMKKETKKKQQNDLWLLGVRKYQSKANEKKKKKVICIKPQRERAKKMRSCL